MRTHTHPYHTMASENSITVLGKHKWSTKVLNGGMKTFISLSANNSYIRIHKAPQNFTIIITLLQSFILYWPGRKNGQASEHSASVDLSKR